MNENVVKNILRENSGKLSALLSLTAVWGVLQYVDHTNRAAVKATCTDKAIMDSEQISAALKVQDDANHDNPRYTFSEQFRAKNGSIFSYKCTVEEFDEDGKPYIVVSPSFVPSGND